MMTNLQKSFKMEIMEFAQIRLDSVKAKMEYDDAAIASHEPVPNHLKKNMDEAIRREATFKENYARKIFEMLSERKPSLLRRRDKEVTEWLSAFGADFESLSPELQASLVALVEEKGGQYRLFKRKICG